jgi:hypothetical protein
VNIPPPGDHLGQLRAQEGLGSDVGGDANDDPGHFERLVRNGTPTRLWGIFCADGAWGS